MHVNAEDADSDAGQGSSRKNGVIVLNDATVDSSTDNTAGGVFTEFVDTDVMWKGSTHEGEAVAGDEAEGDGRLSTMFEMHKLGQKKELKQYMRESVWSAEHGIRHTLWTSLCKHLLRADGDLYDEMDKELFGEDVLAEDIPLPSFVDRVNLTPYHLSDKGINIATKIIAILHHTNPDISYSPTTFSIASLFLHYMGASDVYNCLYALLTCKDTCYIMQTNISFDASKLVVRDLAKKYAKSAYVHIVRHSSNTDFVFENWLWWIYRDLPFSHLVKVTDCFLIEGVKVLYRVVLAILILYNKLSGKGSSPSHNEPVSTSMTHNISRFCERMPVDVTKLMKVAFGIRGLSRKEIQRLEVKHEMYMLSRNHVQSANDRMMRKASTHSIGVPFSRSFSGPIIKQHHLKGSSILSPDMMHVVWGWLPVRLAVCQPELLYTSDEHGTSLRTLYSKIEDRQQTLIFFKNTENEVFGAFCSEPWLQRKTKNKNLSYFGTGETFIFTLYPNRVKYEWVGLLYSEIPNTANMFLAGDTSILTIGGGNGVAVQLDETLNHCRTEKCDTFDNDPLCSEQDFTCKVVEVYGFK